ncbi:addiction module antidote protein, HigA family [Pseudomonas aeruginosa]|uniref:HigA family addiction module antitoxin n=1 Tax=Pseudomonas aeruginosa TaxID=287 RepID=UPI000F5350C9|nr:HigA family addiction module antitoxin [Pseudomonas aeruginosa]RPV48983.1 addiction module antidote protein, HigA family [Pseudomonas aeruginosa]
MAMFNPPHPGETQLEDVLPALGISIAELARRLGFVREILSRTLHGRAPITADLAVRLELAGIGTACSWLGVQADYDLRQARQREPPHIERLVAIVSRPTDEHSDKGP